MRFQNGSLLIVCLVFLSACQQAPPRQAVADPAPGASAASAESSSTFERKVACFEASQAFSYDAVSPRDGVYEAKRSCYLPALETCVVEYVAPDGSAVIFDMLTREPLAVYLNFPGLADEIKLSDRLSRLPANEEASEASGDLTPERREYDRVAALTFEACAR